MSKFRKRKFYPIRWSDNDRYFGPFTYSHDPKYRKWGIMLGSGDGEDYPRCRLRISLGGHTLIAVLPPILKPYREWVDTSQYAWSNGPGSGYTSLHAREYSFEFVEGALHVHYGAQTHSSDTTKSKVYFYPWREHRLVRHSLYDPDHTLFVTLPQTRPRSHYSWRVEVILKQECPTSTFRFADYDGEEIDVVCRIEEREWKRGKGLFRLLYLGRNSVDRSLDLRFLKEMGRRKGSWKGGTIGHSCEIFDGEPTIEAFQRYCTKNGLTFIEDVTLPPTTGPTSLAEALASE